MTSEPGKGTTFTVYLPVSGKQVLHERAPEERGIPGRRRILLMDDEERGATGRYLENGRVSAKKLRKGLKPESRVDPYAK